LAPHLKHEEHPYVISSHQFRHAIATDMIEQGIDIYTVKEFLGHKSLSMKEQPAKRKIRSCAENSEKSIGSMENWKPHHDLVDICDSYPLD